MLGFLPKPIFRIPSHLGITFLQANFKIEFIQMVSWKYQGTHGFSKLIFWNFLSSLQILTKLFRTLASHQRIIMRKTMGTQFLSGSLDDLPDQVRSKMYFRPDSMFFHPFIGRILLVPVGGQVFRLISFPFFLIFCKKHPYSCPGNLNTGIGKSLQHQRNNPSGIDKIGWLVFYADFVKNPPEEFKV